MDKPKKLYRGISVNHKVFDELDLESDMFPPNPPKIDENGREVVGDGNEYGVYMTDNRLMALDVYGNCHGYGLSLGTIGKQYFALPLVGVTFEIYTDGLDIRNPWITSSLQSVYNNGYSGNEWIADYVPSKNIRIYKVLIGKDTLNDSKEIDENLPIDKIKSIVRETIKKRTEGFKICMYHANKRQRNIDYDIKLYQELFNENGVAFEKSLKYDKDNPLEVLRHFMKVEYEKDTENLHYQELNYLLKLKTAFSIDKSVDRLLKMIVDEKKSMNQIISKLIERNASTAHIDREIEFLNKLLSTFESLKPELQKY